MDSQFSAFSIHQFNIANGGTPVDHSGFCGRWSLKNAEILFKDSYTTESGDKYGPVSLDKHPMVKSIIYVCIVDGIFHLFHKYSFNFLPALLCIQGNVER